MVDVDALKSDLYTVLKKHGVSLQVRVTEGHLCDSEEFIAVEDGTEEVAVLNPDHGFIAARTLAKETGVRDE